MENSSLIRCEQLQANSEYIGNPQCSISLDASAGTIINIIGPGHTGKSDWLKVIAGIDQQRSGELWLLGKNTSMYNAEDWVRARTQLAYIHSDTALLSAASALQNIMMPAIYHNTNSKNLKQQALQLLDDVDVNCDINTLPAYLRKDQRYRIAIARALILRPQALILDNPFGVLDITTAIRFKQFLLNLVKQKNILLITVTNDIKFSLRHSDQILFITKNNIHWFDRQNDINLSDIPEIRSFITTEQ